jgi:hypothetical protein
MTSWVDASAHYCPSQAAAANRASWFPGNKLPEHLDGTLVGYFGFDPLGLVSGGCIASGGRGMWLLRAGRL